MVTSHVKTKEKSWLWGSLTSIRLTVSLLLILAAVAVVGTVVPQEQPPGLYLAHYGQTLGSLIYAGRFSQVYFSPWFLLPMGLLALNISACLIQGLPQALRRSLRPFTRETALALPERGSRTWKKGTDPRAHLRAVLKQELGRFRQESQDGQEFYLHQRGRFRPLGPYLVHLALLLVLAGGLIGKFWGVEGSLPLGEGEVAKSFLVGQTERPLPFEVRLDRFQVRFYQESGTPREFRSELSFLQRGREVARATCRVNDPVTFGHLTFYQASYGAEANGPVRLRVRHGDSNATLELPYRQVVNLPDGQGQLFLVRVDGNLQGYGPAAQLAFQAGPGHPRLFWVLKDHPELGEQPKQYRFVAESIPLKFYSVFQVKCDPGVWWVYAGFLLFLPGLYLAFFRPAQRWALILERTAQGGWRARLLGASPRNREEFAETLTRLLAELKKGTPS